MLNYLFETLIKLILSNQIGFGFLNDLGEALIYLLLIDLLLCNDATLFFVNFN